MRVRNLSTQAGPSFIEEKNGGTRPRLPVQTVVPRRFCHVIDRIDETAVVPAAVGCGGAALAPGRGWWLAGAGPPSLSLGEAKGRCAKARHRTRSQQRRKWRLLSRPGAGPWREFTKKDSDRRFADQQPPAAVPHFCLLRTRLLTRLFGRHESPHTASYVYFPFQSFADPLVYGICSRILCTLPPARARYKQ